MTDYIDFIDVNGTEWTKTDRFREAKEIIAVQASEIESLRVSYDAACMLAAQIHEAVMGEVIGPYHGVVEDVRNKVAAQAAVIEKLRQKECDCCGCRGQAQESDA